MIKTKFCYNKDEVVDYLYFHYTKKDKAKWISLIITAFMAAIGVFIILFFSVIIGIIICFASAILIVSYPLRTKSMAKKNALKLTDRQPIDIYIDEDEVTIENRIFKKRYKWEEFSLLCETNAYFYLYLTDTLALIINKGSLFEDEKKELERIIYSKPNKHMIYK